LFWSFEFETLDFVSSFGFRISDLTRKGYNYTLQTGLSGAGCDAERALFPLRVEAGPKVNTPG